MYKLFLFKQVTDTEVLRNLKSLKRKKSAGLDNIPPSLLKDCASVLSKPLAYLINLSFKNGVFPTEWKVTKVLPVHKSGPQSNIENH